MTYTDVEWDETENTGNLSYTGGTVERTSGSGWGNNAGSTKTVDNDIFNTSEQLGKIRFTIDSTAVMVGLGQHPFQDYSYNYADLEFGMYHDSIYESGSEITSDVSFSRSSASDTFTVELGTSGEVKYYFNDSLVHTSTKTASGEYYPMIALDSTGSSITMEQELVVNQQLRVMFYPDNNVQNVTVNQRLRVMFYPDNNVQNIGGGTSAAWKWWLGMRYGTRKRYGSSHIRRMRI